MAWCQGPTGVVEQGMCTQGFSRNLGGPVVSRHGVAVPTGEATKPAGMGGRESERPIVPWKRGNSPRGNPVEGRGLSGHETEGGKDDRDVEP